jgi:hypothetical protein
MNTQTQEALKMAIEVMYCNSPKIGLTQEIEEAIKACKEALDLSEKQYTFPDKLNIANCDLKQPAQEPVAWKHDIYTGGGKIMETWYDEIKHTASDMKSTPLYTHPHQDGTSPSEARDKEFVTLTDDEVDDFMF